MRILFLDESGDLGFSEKSSKYFIITILSCEESDAKILRNISKRLRTRKLKKRYKDLPELKANNTSDIIRETVLKKIKELDIEVYTIIVNKNEVYNYLRDKKHILYNYIANLIISECSISDDNFELIVDKRATKILAREFTDYIENQFKIRNNKCEMKVIHMDSVRDGGLQMADFTSWAIFRKYEYGKDYFYNIINDKITIEKKLYGP